MPLLCRLQTKERKSFGCRGIMGIPSIHREMVYHLVRKIPGDIEHK